MRRAVSTLQDVRARCSVDINTRCWNWLGAYSGKGLPAIYCLDPDAGSKLTMSGPMAVWIIAHGCRPAPGRKVFRSCQNQRCLNPVHLSDKTPGEIGKHMVITGSMRGICTPGRAAAAAKGRASMGIVDTPAETVRAILADAGTLASIAARHGVSVSTASRIRLKQRRAEVQP